MHGKHTDQKALTHETDTSDMKEPRGPSKPHPPPSPPHPSMSSSSLPFHHDDSAHRRSHTARTREETPRVQWDPSTKVERTTVDSRREKKNLLSWRVPHDSEAGEVITPRRSSTSLNDRPRAYTATSTSPSSSSRALMQRSPFRHPTPTSRLQQQLKAVMAQLLEAARTSPKLADELCYVYEEAAKHAHAAAAEARLAKEKEEKEKREREEEEKRERERMEMERVKQEEEEKRRAARAAAEKRNEELTYVPPPWGRGGPGLQRTAPTLMRTRGLTSLPPEADSSVLSEEESGDPPPLESSARDVPPPLEDSSEQRKRVSWCDDDDDMDFSVPPDKFFKEVVCGPTPLSEAIINVLSPSASRRGSGATRSPSGPSTPDKGERSPTEGEKRHPRKLLERLQQSPVKAEEGADAARDRINERLARAAAKREFLNRDRQLKLSSVDDKIASARNKLEIQNEKKRMESERRLDAAAERAQEETRKRELKARLENERVEEAKFLQQQQREERAFELKQREVKYAVKEEQRASREKDRQATREENYQAVMDRKRELEEEREKALQEKIKKREEQMARVDEAKRLEALQREKKAESHAKKVADLKEAAQGRDEEAQRRHQERMQSSAVNRAKSMERIKAKAELSNKHIQEVLERKAEDKPRLNIKNMLSERAKEERAKGKKRASRLTLTMEKMGQEYMGKLEGQEPKSRLSKPLSKLKQVLHSSRIAQSRGALTELAGMIGVHDKTLPTKGSGSLQPADAQYLRTAPGMDILARLLAEDVKSLTSPSADRTLLVARPAAIVLLKMLEPSVNRTHFVRCGCLFPVIDSWCIIMEEGDDDTQRQAMHVAILADVCLHFALTDNSVADLRHLVLSYTDAKGVLPLCRAVLQVPQTALPPGEAELFYTSLSILGQVLMSSRGGDDAKQQEETLVSVLEVIFGLLSNLLLPAGSTRKGAILSPVKGFQVDEPTVSDIPSNE
eukprot:Sspe_Gene.58080::Locus_31861_Transcript_1_1_Confidence_1.000_Length_2958::g.58080::m.58080